MSRLNSGKNGSPVGCLSPAPTRSLKVNGLTKRFDHFRTRPKGLKKTAKKQQQEIAPHFVFVMIFIFVITKLELLAVINLLVEPFKKRKPVNNSVVWREMNSEKWVAANQPLLTSPSILAVVVKFIQIFQVLWIDDGWTRRPVNRPADGLRRQSKGSANKAVLLFQVTAKPQIRKTQTSNWATSTTV